MRKLQRARLVVDHVQAEWREEPEDVAGVEGARGVVVPRDHHDLGVRQRGAQTGELQIRVQDRRVGGAHLMEDVAADQHEVGSEHDHLVQGARERLRHVRLALVDTARRQPLILAVAQVDVGQVYEAQSSRGRGGKPGERRCANQLRRRELRPSRQPPEKLAPDQRLSMVRRRCVTRVRKRIGAIPLAAGGVTSERTHTVTRESVIQPRPRSTCMAPEILPFTFT